MIIKKLKTKMFRKGRKGNTKMNITKIYTDGACSGNQNDSNVGGWGAVLEYGKHIKEIYGGEINTTNNRMEMKALLNALGILTKSGLTIHVFSDSSYLMNCFREKWYEKWIRNNWKTSSKTNVENKDLWEELLKQVNRHNILFFRVKGHLDIDNKNIDMKKWYEKFIEWNGSAFSMDDFIHITRMNHRADALANQGINESRKNFCV